MTTILIILALLGIAYFVFSFIMKRDLPKAKLVGSLSASLLVFLVFIALFITKIGGQEVGVVETPSGIKNVPYHTGWHFIWPWYTVHKMDKTVWVYTFTKSKSDGQKAYDDAIWAPTSEGIKMGFDLSVSWKIDANASPWIYQNVSEQDGTEDGRYKWIEENIIRAKTKSIFALTVSKFTPIECYSGKRQEIQDKVFMLLAKELVSYHLILNQIDLREVFYDPQYEAEIKNKKVQEQKALTLLEVTKQKQEELIQAKISKEINIQTAQGEAEALKIKGTAISQNPRVVELNLIEKWDGSLPNTLIQGSSGGNQSLLLQLVK